MGNFEQKGEVSHALVAAARLVPHQVSRVKLSKTQLRVLESIKEGEEVTASQIAERLGLSVSWASSLLRESRRKNYLMRSYSVKSTGGGEYIYMKELKL